MILRQSGAQQENRMKRFTINGDGIGTYVLVPSTGDIAAQTVTLDMEKVFGWSKLAEMVQKAVAFATGHVLRNATAGKMEKVADALAAIGERAKALADGKWTAHKESGEAGESRESLLARALAAVMETEPKDAAEFISGEIRGALEEKNIDPDIESDDLTADQKTERRKVANAVRKSIAEDAGVALQLSKLKLAAATAKLAETEKATAGKASAFSK